MGKRKDRIPEMEPKELKKLRRKLKKTSKEILEEGRKTLEHLRSNQDALRRIWKLENRVNYWIGKAKALNCPAYKHTGNSIGKCMIYSPEVSWDMKFLFSFFCSSCKLSKEKAMKKATFNGIFGKRGESKVKR